MRCLKKVTMFCPFGCYLKGCSAIGRNSAVRIVASLAIGPDCGGLLEKYCEGM